MKASTFKYLHAQSKDEAYAAFAEYGDEAVILAGGQSLMPMLNMRLAQPAVLVDINPISELSGIVLLNQQLHIGATTRHVDVANADLIAAELPLIGCAIKQVAHRGIRNRGTFGGSLAHADPAAEMPACAVALDATFVLQSRAEERRVKAVDFFLGVMTTDRRPDEILTTIELPAQTSNDAWAFHELSRRHGDFALVGVAATARRRSEGLEELRLVVFGCEERPRISKIAASTSLSQKDALELATAVAEDLDPMSDLEGDAKTKRIQARTLIQRALDDLFVEGANG
ncbi:MAG: FAD binding domain-containing protein [Rhodospirillales bacterium]|jgi:carbon-monoxide dehydrogenase medium subunit